MPSDTWSTPRPIPSRLIPALAGTAVIALALPVFLIAGWPIGSWLLAAGLWLAFQVVGVLLERLPLGMDSLASAGVVAIGRTLRAAGLVGILIIVTVRDSDLGFPAAIVYAIAFSVEFGLSLLMYFDGGEEKR
jgi:hypothetical protein